MNIKEYLYLWIKEDLNDDEMLLIGKHFCILFVLILSLFCGLGIAIAS